MKSNQVFWKTHTKENARDILRSLRDNYLVIQLAERKNNKLKILFQFDSGMQYEREQGIREQLNFIKNNSIKNMYQFYIIRSV